jgi:hypothetical protein
MYFFERKSAELEPALKYFDTHCVLVFFSSDPEGIGHR